MERKNKVTVKIALKIEDAQFLKNLVDNAQQAFHVKTSRKSKKFNHRITRHTSIS